MRRRPAIAGVLVLGVLAGCGLVRTVPPVRYYTLTVTAAPAVRVAGPVRVGVFTADQPYATERIAYRSSPYRLDYYTYHRWAADPRNLLRDAVRDYLEAGAAAGNGPPLEVEGNIRRLEEVDGTDGWSAALTLDLRIARGGTILLERSYAETEPAADRHAEAVAAALSRALQRILDHALAELPASGR